MKLLLSILLTSFFVFADIASMKDIRKEYASIRNDLPDYHITVKNLEGFSAEGGEAIVYKDSDNLVKMIKLSHFGEMGKSVEEYYFENNKLFFIYEVNYNYNAPAYLAQYDEKKTQVTKERFYFIDDSMVRWLNKDHPVEYKSRQFLEKEKSIYDFVRHFLIAMI